MTTTRHPCTCDISGARFCDNCIESGRADAADRAPPMCPVSLLAQLLDDEPEEDEMGESMASALHL